VNPFELYFNCINYMKSKLQGIRILAFGLAGLFFSGGVVAQQGVNIGSGQPANPSATLEVSGNQGGLLLPRLTTTERNAITSPAVGLLIYNLSSECLEMYFPVGWKVVECNCSQPPPAPTVSISPAQACLGQSGVVLRVSPVSGAQSYQWSVPAEDTLISPQGSDSIVVNLGNLPGTRQYQVVATNTCGSSPSFSFSLIVQNPNPGLLAPTQVTIGLPSQFQSTSSGLTYSWNFNGGSPAQSSLQQEQVTWSSVGNYLVSLQVADAFGCTASDSVTVQASTCFPATYTFTNCGATGRSGPTQVMCDQAYGPGVVSVTSGIQFWTVPATGTYRIWAEGAQGGDCGSIQGGAGASMRGDFNLTAGTVLKLLVGQRGGSRTPASSNNAAAGGGGSFVVLTDNTPLVVAGGGGGAGSGGAGGTGLSGVNGGNALGSSPGLGGLNGGGGGAGQSGAAGTQTQNGGLGGSCSYGPGGGGFFTHGGQNCSGNIPLIAGFSFVSGGLGGPADVGSGGVEGGFGGGAGVGHRASAGGGYSGGGGNGASSGGGGGGSFNSGTNQQNTAGARVGHGEIRIERICQ